MMMDSARRLYGDNYGSVEVHVSRPGSDAKNFFVQSTRKLFQS